MRRFGAGLLMVALALPMAGCGMNVEGLSAGNAAGGLVLADEANGSHFLLSVAGGAAELAKTSGTGAASSDLVLIDPATGTAYSLAVRAGALTLTAAAGGEGVRQIDFVDAVTDKPYALAVAGGALTLIPG
jgi:hypothetical protein